MSPLASNMSLALSADGAGNHAPGHKGGGGLRQALGMGHAPQAHARVLLGNGELYLILSRVSVVPLCNEKMPIISCCCRRQFSGRQHSQPLIFGIIRGALLPIPTLLKFGKCVNSCLHAPEVQ